jgi:hypothetical protein
VSDAALDPVSLLSTLSACGVDYVVIGAMAVGVHAEVRATGDVDVMVPVGDERNKRALAEALEQLHATQIPADQGGVDPTAGDRYPTVMFHTRHGKLDVLYRPDGSDAYPKVKQRAVHTRIGGQPVQVVGKDDLINMKLAAGRPNDFVDVANLTAQEHGTQRHVFASMALAPSVDEDWARDLALARVAHFDPAGRAWTTDGWLRVEASRADLTDAQITRWAQALAERLHGAGVLADTQVHIEIDGSGPGAG